MEGSAVVGALRVVVFKGAGVQPWRFRLVSGNGRVLTQSEGYVSRWNARRGARRAHAGLPIVDGKRRG